MSKPMSIDFFVAVPNENAGNRVAEVAAQRNYSVKVELDTDDQTWTCYCSKTLLATYESVIASQAELERIGSPWGGYCDGWGTFGNV